MKKTISLLAVLFLLVSGSADAMIAVNGGVSALVTEEGETIIQPHTFSAIERVTDKLFSVKSPETGKYALMTRDGEMLTESQYTLFRKLEGGILFETGGKYGVMDETAAVIVPAEYTWLIENGEGGYLALRTDVWDNAADGVYLIDETGYVSPTGVKVASFLMEFSEGLSPALSTDNGRYGYLNPEGQWAIRPQYAYADSFENGIAAASLDSGSGVIGKTGGWMLTPKYDFVDIGPGENACILCVEYAKGVTAFSADDFKVQYALNADTYGAYVSFAGNTVVAYLQDRVIEFDENGRERLSVSADGYLFPAAGGCTIAYENNEARLVNKHGATVFSGCAEMDELGVFGGETYFTFARDAGDDPEEIRLGVVNGEGEILLNAEYTSVSRTQEGFILAENDGGLYLADDSGRIIWQYEY